jgi:hypothetical protein
MVTSLLLQPGSPCSDTLDLYGEQDALVDIAGARHQGRRGRVAPGCLTRRCGIAEPVAALRLERGHAGHHRFAKAGPLT